MPQKSNSAKSTDSQRKKSNSAGKTTSGKKRTGTPKSGRNKRKNSQSSVKHTLIWGLVYLLLIGFLAVAGFVFYCYITMPDIQKAVSRTRQPSTIILAENGVDIAKFGHVYAEVIYPDNLPKNVTDAIIATEDRRFYKHFGFDIFGFSRALITNVFNRRYAQGASTITQQVAKNIFLTPNKNIRRKVQELILALWLEQKFSKNQIMALYLNRVYFGSGLYGLEAASEWYFNKNAHKLNLHEAAILAGMLKAPNRYNPILQRENALARAAVVLQNMRKNGYLTEKQYKEALAMPISNGQQYRVAGGKHFANYVYKQVNNYIGERAEDIVVMTTLNQKLQETAEKILRAKVRAAKDKNVSEGAMIIMDKSGAIKAMVGGVDYNRSQFNRAVQALRQPGSAFKTFVYLTALQYGFTPDSIINDAPLTINKWKPENYSKKYYGKVTLDYALTHSLNVATVALSRELYLRDIAENAHKMGISTPLNLTPSMVLGTNSVKLADMATAYAVLASGGKAVWPYAINEISTHDGRQLFVREADEDKTIIAASVVRKITEMLEHVINRGTGKAARLPIFAAGKTGTSQNYRDAWFVGWTNKYIAAVWVGNDNEKPMLKVGGGNLPAEIWHDVMMTTIGETTAITEADDIADLIDDVADDKPKDDEYAPVAEHKAPQTMDELLDSI